MMITGPPPKFYGTRDNLGLAEDQVITGPAALLAFDCPAAMPRQPRSLPAGTLLTPRGEQIPHS
jgi:hypothetical protein